MPVRMTLPTAVVLDQDCRAQTFGRYHSLRRARVAAAPGFDVPAQLAGSTPDGKTTVYYDPSLGQPAADLAQQILAIASTTYAICQAFFNIRGQPINVIIVALSGATDGSGGAYHGGCDFISGRDLYCDAAFGNPALTGGLIVAELTECFMGQQNLGWDCGASNGEALSRFLAQQVFGGPDGVLAKFATAPQWERAGRPNWLDATAPTDQDPVSTGCGVVYLYWMLSKGFSVAQITQVGCPNGTLSSNYAKLTGQTTAWADFRAALKGLSGAIISDDPWQSPPAAVAHQTAEPVPARGQILIDAAAMTVRLSSDWKVAGTTSTPGARS